MNLSSLLVEYGYANILLCVGFAIGVGLHILPPTLRRHISSGYILKINYAIVACVLLLPFIWHLLPQQSIFEPTAQIWSAPSMVHEAITTSTSSDVRLVPFSVMNAQTNLPLEIVMWGIAFVFALGFVLHSFRLLIDAMKIKRIMRHACLIKTIDRADVFVSSHIRVPLSFWTPNRFAIVVPYSFLENEELLSVAMLHENQHHRQGDTRWIYVLQLLKLLFYWNPIVHLWTRSITEIQEFACDEALVDRHNISPRAYCGCLVRAAELAMETCRIPVCAAGMAVSVSGRTFKRRMSVMLNHRRGFRWSFVGLVCGIIAFAAMFSTAFASHGLVQDRRITIEKAEELANNAIGDENFSIVINDRVLTQLNRYLGTPDGRKYMKEALERMEGYRDVIEKKLAEYNAPDELMAVPLIESGYKNLPPEVNRVRAAGLWQFIPTTARNYGLRVDDQLDERLDVELETDAAMRLLLANKLRFKDWGLSLLAYNAGERKVQKGIRAAGEHDVWMVLDAGFENDKDYVAKVVAAIIILKNPSVLD